MFNSIRDNVKNVNLPNVNVRPAGVGYLTVYNLQLIACDFLLLAPFIGTIFMDRPSLSTGKSLPRTTIRG